MNTLIFLLAMKQWIVCYGVFILCELYEDVLIKFCGREKRHKRHGICRESVDNAGLE